MKKEYRTFSNHSVLNDQELYRISSRACILEQQPHFELDTCYLKNVFLEEVRGQSRQKTCDTLKTKNTTQLFAMSQHEVQKTSLPPVLFHLEKL